MNRDITNTQSNDSSLKGIFIQSMFAGLSGLIAAFIALCIISIFLFANPLSYETVSLISMGAKYTCAIIAALIACIKRKSKGYIRGLIGALTFVLLGAMFFSLIASDGFSSRIFLYDALICSVLGIVTGAFVVNFNAKRK